MKRMLTAVMLFVAAIAPAVAAESTERTQSVIDANPACRERTGPDCVLRGVFASPPVILFEPRGVDVVPTPAQAPVPPMTNARSKPIVLAPLPPPVQRAITIAP